MLEELRQRALASGAARELRKLGLQDLERHVSSHVQIARSPDHADSALTHDAVEQVAAAQECPGERIVACGGALARQRARERRAQIVDALARAKERRNELAAVAAAVEVCVDFGATLGRRIPEREQSLFVEARFGHPQAVTIAPREPCCYVGSMAGSDQAWASATQRWPTIKLERATFEARLVETQLTAVELVVYAEDLYLACAASLGDATAVATVDSLVMSEASRALGRLGLDEAARDDVRQIVREKLFVPKSGASASAIGRYSGRGPLGAWLRATLVHAALSTLRTRARAPEDVSLSRLPDDASDPDLVRLRERYGEAFREAFQAALVELSPRQRNVLRMTHLDGLTAEQVGSTYGVHRVSVARWLGEARAALLERTRASLRAKLSVTSDELSSLTRLCLSELDVSLARLLT